MSTVGIRLITPEERSAMETKHDRFLRLAPDRVQKALDAIERVGNLASSGNLYSEEEIAKIVNVLNQAVHNIEVQLTRRITRKEIFSFE